MRSVRDEADAFIARIRSRGAAPADLDVGVKLLEQLKDVLEFEKMGDLAEALARVWPNDGLVRSLYAQALIDTGRSAAALDVLQAATKRPGLTEDAEGELYGLLGRANKQIFMDAPDRSTDVVRAALDGAIEGYRVPFERKPKKYWHGINLAAVLHAAQRAGIKPPGDLDRDTVARSVLTVLESVPETERDLWWSATKGEAFIALGEWERAESALHDYVTDAQVPAFALASTLRQLREVWEIHRQGPVGAGLLQLLEARLAHLRNATLELRPDYVRAMRQTEEPSLDQRQRVLGDIDAQPVRWYRTALGRAESVAAVRYIGGKRIGTAFAVQARALGLPRDEVLILTNFHVVNREGASKAEKPGSVELMFESAGEDGLGPYPIEEIVAESPFEGGLDYALLRLPAVAKLPPALPTTLDLPALERKPRVCVIGHPYMNELHIALQDNELLDHEGPPTGSPSDPACRRVHYFTPTAQGNSGSPVFDQAWNVIALHHLGFRYEPLASQLGLPRLNGKSGRYSANEGVWIGSICEDLARKLKSAKV